MCRLWRRAGWLWAAREAQWRQGGEGAHLEDQVGDDAHEDEEVEQSLGVGDVEHLGFRHTRQGLVAPTQAPPAPRPPNSWPLSLSPTPALRLRHMAKATAIPASSHKPAASCAELSTVIQAGVAQTCPRFVAGRGGGRQGGEGTWSILSRMLFHLSRSGFLLTSDLPPIDLAVPGTRGRVKA